MKLTPKILALALTCAAALPAAAQQQVTGAGSTFVYPVLSAGRRLYSKLKNVRVNYQSIGSGGGIAQIKAGTVDFGASDKPLTPNELAEAGLAQFPSSSAASCPVVNIEGVAARRSSSSPARCSPTSTWARSRSGTIPAIAQLNPGRQAAGRRDHRRASLGWLGHDLQLRQLPLQGHAGVEGQGRRRHVRAVAGRRRRQGQRRRRRVREADQGFDRLCRARLRAAEQDDVRVLQNAAGKFVQPDARAFQAAAASADWTNAKDFYLVITNAPGENSWPITATTFILMYKQPKDPAGTQVALDFFKWALENGGQQAEELDYVPLPKGLVEQIEANWKSQIRS